MRLWHQHMIPYLSDQHILGQHRECAALRGNGWGKKHIIVDYVFEHSPLRLYLYHRCIMEEMGNRGFSVDEFWSTPSFRGRTCKPWPKESLVIESHLFPFNRKTTLIYEEHDYQYLLICLRNLEEKGFDISHITNGLKSEGRLSSDWPSKLDA